MNVLGMAEVAKLLYIVVLDDGGQREERSSSSSSSFRYTRSVLQSTLQLMGCKPRHAFKISQRVFDVIRSKCSANGMTLLEDRLSGLDALEEPLNKGSDHDNMFCHLTHQNVGTSSSLPFELYKRLTTAVVSKETFLDVVCNALTEYKYVSPNQKADLVLACRIRERKESVIILLCGTSGCGKSTLSALLGNRLGITTVISTDSIRHMMRSFVDEKQNPLLWASTYHAGDFLDPEAVAEAKVRRKAKKLASISHPRLKEKLSDGGSNEKYDGVSQDVGCSAELIGKKQMVIEGFKAQSEMVMDSLDRLITAWEDRKQSVVVEGVHLSLNFVMGLMKKHPSIIPFMVYITNEEKHMERFAVRAKYMTLDPAKNKYVKYIRNIRTIQDYLCNRADKHLVPKINNTNVDKSVALIHATVFSCLRRREAGELLYDPTTNTVPIIFEEYKNHGAANSLSSKGMFQLIQRMGSSRHLMALCNTDGSVAKVWPCEPVDGVGKRTSSTGSERVVGVPACSSFHIGKAETVNLQFGNFGISAWPNDSEGTSHTGSIEDSRLDGIDTGSRCVSSRCSSPGLSEGPAKEPMEELSFSGSEEEADDIASVDSDDDLNNTDNKDFHEEMEGSIDEESTRSDEEYEDLAMQDGLENVYSSDDEEEQYNLKRPPYEKPTGTYSEKSMAEYQTEKYLREDLDTFCRTNGHHLEPSTLFTSTEPEKHRSKKQVIFTK